MDPTPPQTGPAPASLGLATCIRHGMCWGLPTGSPAWRALDPYARDAYCWIERRFRRTNNGKIPMSARDLADDMGVNKDTAQKALVRLRVFGFIVPTEKGRMAGPYGERRATRWRLTEYGMDGSLPTRDYLDIHIDKARSRCNRLFERPTSSDATSHHVGRMRPPRRTMANPKTATSRKVRPTSSDSMQAVPGETSLVMLMHDMPASRPAIPEYGIGTRAKSRAPPKMARQSAQEGRRAASAALDVSGGVPRTAGTRVLGLLRGFLRVALCNSAAGGVTSARDRMLGMTTADTDLREFIHERFRKTDEKLDCALDYMVTVIERLGSLEKQAAGLREDVARLDHRLDGFEKRLARIEKRLDLVEAPGG